MRSKINTSLRAIKEGLKLCHEKQHKGKYTREEYILFGHLAQLYLFTRGVEDYPKVAAIYQYQLKLLERLSQEPDSQQMLKETKENIASIEGRFLATLGIEGAGSEKIDRYKEELKLFRERISGDLSKIEHLGIEPDGSLKEAMLPKRTQAVENIYSNIVSFFIGEGTQESPEGLVRRMLQGVITDLGGLPQINGEPVEYTVFGLGSLSLGTITPWSDMEFGILIQENIPILDLERVKEFFRNVTRLLHIRVVAFGETPLRMMGITELNNFKIIDEYNTEHNWFYDDLIKSGFSFDGPHSHACKSPSGRQGYREHIDFELIGSPSQLAKFQEKKWYKRDPALSQSLRHATFIMGSVRLIQTYKKLCAPNTAIASELVTIFLQDLVKFEPHRLLVAIDGRVLNTKKEIYRFPERVICSFGEMIGAENIRIWNMLPLLEKNYSINTQIFVDLKNALSIATELRLRVYAHYKSQTDDLSGLGKDANDAKTFFADWALLCYYYHVVISLTYTIGIDSRRNELLLQVPQYDTLRTNPYITYIKGLLSSRFLQYKAAAHEYNELARLLKKDSDMWNHTFHYNIAEFYRLIGKYSMALKHHEQALKMRQEIYNEPHLDIANSLNNIGIIYRNIGQYEKALQYLSASLKMKVSVNYIKEDADTTFSNLDINSTYKAREQLEDVQDYFKQAVTKRLIKYQVTHPDIATSLNDIALVYHAKGQYDDALWYYSQAQQIEQTPARLASLLNNVGNVYQAKGCYDAALGHYKQALEIKQQLYKGSHTAIAASLNNIGVICKCTGSYVDALKYHEQALKMQEDIYDKADHPDIAASLNNIGNVHQSRKQCDKALAYYTQALAMQIRLYGQNHPTIANSLYNLGNTYIIQGNYKTAHMHIKHALDMCSILLPPNHPNIAIYNKKLL